MKCAICLTEIESTEQGINEDWIPYFYEGEKEHGPACPSCFEQFLVQGADGEIDLKEEYQGKMTYSDGDYADKLKDDMDDERILVGIFLPAPEEETH